MSDINEVKYGAGSSAKRTAAAKVFKNIYKDVKTQRNADYSKIFVAVKQGANAPGKLPLDPAAMEIVPWVEDVTVEIEGDGTAFLFTDSDIMDVAYDVAEQLLDALRKDGLIPLKGMREGKRFTDFRKTLNEQSYRAETISSKELAEMCDDLGIDLNEDPTVLQNIYTQLYSSGGAAAAGTLPASATYILIGTIAAIVGVNIDMAGLRAMGKEAAVRLLNKLKGIFKAKDAKSSKKLTTDQKDQIKDAITSTLKTEQTLGSTLRQVNEGAVKAAMEDWMESLPKAVVDEINKKYAAKLKAAELTGLSKGDPIRKALIQLLDKHNVKPALGDKSREMDISALEMMFNTFFGESVEVSEENLNIGTYGFRIDRDSGKFVLYQLSYSQGSVRFPDGRKGTVIGRYATRDEAIAAAKRQAGVKEAAPAKKADDEVEEATDTAPSESDLKIWYKATGAVSPFEGAVPSYKLLKKMFLRDKKQENKAWKIWQDLVKKGKVSESVEVDEAVVKVALNPNKKIGYQVTDVGPGGKRTVSKSENFPEEEAIIQVREAGHQTLYRYKGKYYIVSYSSLANETMIFAGDAKGKPTSYEGLWSDRGGVHPDAAIKEYLSHKFKKDLQVKIG